MKKTRPWMCRGRQEVELLSMIKIKWNLVFDGPKRHRLWESRGQKEERERRGGAWRVEKTPGGETSYGVAGMLRTVMSKLHHCLFWPGL